MERNDASSLVGKTALITGGSRGIGAGIAFQFAKKGLTALAITYANSKDAAEEVLTKCQQLGVAETIALEADLLDPQVGPKLIPKVLDNLKAQTLDIVVNNAAVIDMRLLEPFERITLEAFSKTMQGHVFGMISIVQTALPHFPPRGGRVINVSSTASKTANADPLMTYGASKAAVDSFSRSLAATYGVKSGATFNSLSVGRTITDTVRAVDAMAGSAFKEQAIDAITTEKRLAEPEDIAFVAGFLASEEGRWINGANIAVNGGNRALLALQG